MVCIHREKQRERERVCMYIYVCVCVVQLYIRKGTCTYITSKGTCAKTSSKSTTPGRQLRRLAESAKIRLKRNVKNRWLNRDTDLLDVGFLTSLYFVTAMGIIALDFVFHGFSFVVRKSLPSYTEQTWGKNVENSKTATGVTAHLRFFVFYGTRQK